MQAHPCLRVEGTLCESYAIGVEVRSGCTKSPWLLNILKDICMGEMKAKVRNAAARLRLNGVGWSVVTWLFADNTVLPAEVQRNFKEPWMNFSVCLRRLKVNVGMGKVMVLERK